MARRRVRGGGGGGWVEAAAQARCLMRCGGCWRMGRVRPPGRCTDGNTPQVGVLAASPTAGAPVRWSVCLAHAGEWQIPPPPPPPFSVSRDKASPFRCLL